jgi:hypothetical protein
VHRPGHRTEQLVVCLGHDLVGELRTSLLPAGGPEPGALPVVGHQPPQRSGQGGGVVGRHDQAGLTIDHRLPHASHVGRHHREPPVHGFEE